MKRASKIFLLCILYVLPTVVRADVANVVFTTTPQTLALSAVSETITLQAQDSNGSAISGGIPQTGCIALTSTSPTGQFSSSATSWNPVTVLTMNKSSSNRNFYYTDTVEGTYTLTAAFVLKPTSVTASCASWPEAQWGTLLEVSQTINIGTSANVPSSPPPGDPSTPVDTATTSAQTITVSSLNIGSETLKTDIKTEPVVMVGGGSFFTGTAWDSEGTKAAGTRYLWNFGDGATDEGQTVFHTYAYPGTYAVGLTVGAGDEAGMGRTTVQAMPAQIGVVAEPDGSVVLSNQAGQEINVGLWSISSATSTFVLPQDTIILGGQSVRFAPSVMDMNAGTDTILRYPNNAPVATTIPPVQPAQATFLEASTLKPARIVSSIHSSVKTTKNSTSVSKKIATTSVATSSTLAAGAADSTTSLPLWSWILGAGGIILIGIGAFSYARHPSKKETNTGADEFEIEG